MRVYSNPPCLFSTFGAMAVFGAVVVIVAVSRVELFGVHSLSENPRNCSVGHMTSTTLPQCGSGLPRDRATDWMLKVWAARTRAKLIIIMT